MVEASIEAVVLLPIKPKYAEAIFYGIKKVEFRKINFSRKISHVIVYSSSPTKKVIGYFTVKSIEAAKPNRLWNKFRNVGGISFDDFKAYFFNKKAGIAIVIDEIHKLKKPILLSEICSISRAPQNYAYLSSECLSLIQSLELE